MPDALDDLTAPVDPRVGGPAPPFGQMAVEADLDELTSRVLAPNPGHFSLDGTNTYVIGRAGSGAAIVVDPGPDDPAHLARVRAALARRDAECAYVLVTHHHVDHAEAAQAWARSFGCRVAAASPDVAGQGGLVLRDGDAVEAAGTRIEAVATPGHCADHLSFRPPHGPLLTGDHVLGRGTSVVGGTEGDMSAYVSSLHRVLELGPDALYPGHGPEMAEGDPLSVVRYYVEHRAFREQQILAVLAEGPAEPAAMVRRIYAAYDERLWPAAERSTRAALAKMADEGRVVLGDDDTVHLP